MLRRSFFQLLLGLVAFLGLGAGVQAQSGSYTLSSGTGTGPIAANPGATNVQVTPTTGTVVVSITYEDGKTRVYTATRDAPVNVTRWRNDHSAYAVESIAISYPPQPPGTHDALGRYKIQ
ncbi:MAG: hypothetical protein R3F56_20675 [Planctomycetota bacterium]